MNNPLNTTTVEKWTKGAMEAELMARFGLSRPMARDIMSCVLDSMADVLDNGGKVVLKGVGAIEPREIPEHTHKGFGDVYVVPARRGVSFTLSGALDERLNPPKDPAKGMEQILAAFKFK